MRGMNKREIVRATNGLDIVKTLRSKLNTPKVQLPEEVTGDMIRLALRHEVRSSADVVMKALKEPLSYKVKNGKVKGRVASIPIADLTKFVINPEEKCATPVWVNQRGKSKGDFVIDLLPMLAYGFACSLGFLCDSDAPTAEWYDSSATFPMVTKWQDANTELTLDWLTTDVQNQLLGLLVTNPDFPIASTIITQRLIDARKFSEDTFASILLDYVEGNKQLMSSFLFGASNNDNFDFKEVFGSGTYTYRNRILTNTEAVCYILSNIWLGYIVKCFSTDDMLSEFPMEHWCELDMHTLFSYLGNDTVGYLLRGMPTEDELLYKCDKANVQRLFGCKICRNEAPIIISSRVYDRTLFSGGAAFEFNTFRIYNTLQDEKRKRIEAEESKEALVTEIAALNRKLSGLSILEEEHEAEKDRLRSELSYEISRLQKQVESLQQHVIDLEAVNSSYYTDDSVLEEVGVSKVSIEDCIDYINQFNLCIVGGRFEMGNKLNDIGYTNFRQVYSATDNMNFNTDFYVVMTRFVSHNLVESVKASHDTSGLLYYYNGTNIENFIYATYDFIKSYIES